MKKAKGGKAMPFGKPMMDDKNGYGKKAAGKSAAPAKKGKKK